MYDLAIINGLVATEKEIKKAALYVNGGKISKICEDQKIHQAKRIIDAMGQYVFPGFIDPHVHLNDPGLTNSEDFYTGTCAAAAGGITTVLEHPLTFPLPDNLKDFIDKKEIGESKAITNFALFGACSENNQEEMAKIIEAGAVAFKIFLTYSTEIPMLNDGQILEKMKFLAPYDIVLAIHCENNDICEHYSKKMQAAGKTKPFDYPKGRPDISEIEAVSRMSLFAEKTGCKANVAHCTLKEAVDIVTQHRANGADISVETCPHYLILDESMMHELGVFSICNPPLRTRKEVERLWESIFEGKLDWVCSDHATYTFEEKLLNKENAFMVPAGTTGIETCFQLFFSEGVSKRGLPVNKFVELSSTNAAKRYRLYPQKGILAEGADADITIFDPNLKWFVNNTDLKQMMKWSPYQGMEVTGKVTSTIVNGHEVYDGKDIIAEKGSGKFVKPV